MFTFSFRYSHPFLRRYYVAELWRTQGAFLIAVPIAVALVVLLVRNRDFLWVSCRERSCRRTYLPSLLARSEPPVARSVMATDRRPKLTPPGIHK